jgi:hypothetical protein
MASLTIGGQVRELRLTVSDIDQAERQIIKAGGRAILDVLGNRGGLFAKHELEWIVWGSWRHRMSTDRIQTLLAQFYGEGGTIFDLQGAITEALIDSGLYGARQTRQEEEESAGPQSAGMSA